MHKVKFTEKMRTSRVAGGTHLQAQVNHLGSIISNHYAMTQPVEDFEVVVDFKKKKKTTEQLRGFYELLSQILPQYNERECECPEDQINKDDFKDFLKGIGGWQEEKGKAKATIFALHNFANFKRAYKGEFVSNEQLKNEMIEADSKTIISKSFDNITKEQLHIVICKIINWGNKNKYQFNISN